MNRVDLQSLQSIRDCDYQDTVWEQTKAQLYAKMERDALTLLGVDFSSETGSKKPLEEFLNSL